MCWSSADDTTATIRVGEGDGQLTERIIELDDDRPGPHGVRVGPQPKPGGKGAKKGKAKKSPAEKSSAEKSSAKKAAKKSASKQESTSSSTPEQSTTSSSTVDEPSSNKEPS